MKDFWDINKFVLYIALVIAISSTAWWFFFFRTSDGESILTVHPGEFLQQVSVSGKVIAAENVDLGFNQNGRISKVYVKVGDTAQEGLALAVIENDDLKADLLQKEAALENEQAKLKALESGTRPEEVAVAKSSVASAESALSQAKESVVNAIQNAYTQSDDAIRRRADQFISNPKSSNPQVNFSADGQLKSDVESGRYLIEIMLASWKTSLDTLSSADDLGAHANAASKNLNQVKDFLGKVAQMVNSLAPGVSLTQTTIDSYRADITTARSNVNSAIITLASAVSEKKSAESALATKESELKLKEAGSREDDINAQAAKVKSAGAEVLSAKAKLAKTVILAPFSGVVTKMDAKVGKIVSPNVSEISMISADVFQIESFVPEINVALLKIGNEAIVTLDAYGDDTEFLAKVISIDPAETIKDGVSTYRAKLQFSEKDERVKSGMTANVLITTEKKSGVITIPQGIIQKNGSQKFVIVREGGREVEHAVETGSVSSLGQIEITSGLSSGDVVLLSPAKETINIGHTIPLH